MPKAPTIRGGMPKAIRAPFRAYTAVIGELVWASNYSHGAFEILFSHVATPTEFQTGRSIWHSAPSDSGQLQMLAAATETSARLSAKMRANILWAVEKAKKLGESRNDAVHSSTIILSRAKPVKIALYELGTKPKRYGKLERTIDLKKHFRLVKGDLWKLGQYVHALWPHLAGFDALPPLPRRPRLTSIQNNNSKKRVKNV